MRVDGLRLAAGGTVTLAEALEQLVVPLEGAIDLEGAGAVGRPGLARVPAGVAGRLRARADATALVIGAPAPAEPGAATVALDLDAVDYVVPETSDVAIAFLTGPLGCAGTKANARRLEPGQAVPYHTEGDQEELFVPVEGPAAIRVADATHRLEVGAVARVAPAVPRSALNDGDRPARWVMVGAPPTGGPTGWDPGAETLE